MRGCGLVGAELELAGKSKYCRPLVSACLLSPLLLADLSTGTLVLSGPCRRDAMDDAS